MATQYIVRHPDRPHVVLFAAPTVAEAAAALAVQPNADELTIYPHWDGASRKLDDEERSQLAAALCP